MCWQILRSFINKSWQNVIISDIYRIEELLSKYGKDVVNNPVAREKEIKCQSGIFRLQAYLFWWLALMLFIFPFSEKFCFSNFSL
jgi:hypothetical protein